MLYLLGDVFTDTGIRTRTRYSVNTV